MYFKCANAVYINIGEVHRNLCPFMTEGIVEEDVELIKKNLLLHICFNFLLRLVLSNYNV